MRQAQARGRLDVLAMGLLQRQVAGMDPGTQAVMGVCQDLLQGMLTGLVGPQTGLGQVVKKIVKQGTATVQPVKAKSKDRPKTKPAKTKSKSRSRVPGVQAYTKPQGPPDWSQPAVEVEAELIEG